MRRDRAARMGPELFLLDRAFDDCVDRLGGMTRRFGRALLIGCPSPAWPGRLGALADRVDAFDPGTMFATGAGVVAGEEDRNDFGVGEYDLCVAVGTLDTVNDLPLALQLIRRSLRPDSPFIGALAGGDSLPALRLALIEADRAAGRAAAHTHPRIEPASLAALLGSAGFSMPVVDVDRVTLRYRELGTLVRDLRRMGAGNCLAERAPPFSRDAARRAAAAFSAAGSGGRTEESVEILHFLGWAQ